MAKDDMCCIHRSTTTIHAMLWDVVTAGPTRGFLATERLDTSVDPLP